MKHGILKVFSFFALVCALCVGCAYGLVAGLVVAFASASALQFQFTGGALCVVANNPGSLAATGILYDALGITLKRLPFLKRLASDLAPSMAEKGLGFNVAQVLKNFNAAQTVSDRASTGTYAKQAGVDFSGDQSFSLNKWPYVTIQLSALEVNTMVDTYTNKDARALAVNKLLQKGFNAFGLNIVNDFLAVITAANFTQNYASAVGTMDFKKLGRGVDVLLRNDALNIQKPDAILEVDCFREFSDSLTAIYNYTGVDEVVRDAAISEPVSGANSVSRYNIAMPVDAPRGIIFDPSAIVFANRVPIEEKLPNDPVYTEVITDPSTGFSILYREAKDPLSGEVARTITTLYGFAPGLKNHLTRITTV